MSSTIKLKRGRNVVIRNSFTNAERVSEYSLGTDSVLNYNRIKMPEHGNDFIFSNSNISRVLYKNRLSFLNIKLIFFFFVRVRSSTRVADGRRAHTTNSDGPSTTVQRTEHV